MRTPQPDGDTDGTVGSDPPPFTEDGARDPVTLRWVRDAGVSWGGSSGVMGSLTCSTVSKTTADDQLFSSEQRGRQGGSAAEWRWEEEAGSQGHTGDR